MKHHGRLKVKVGYCRLAKYQTADKNMNLDYNHLKNNSSSRASDYIVFVPLLLKQMKYSCSCFCLFLA